MLTAIPMTDPKMPLDIVLHAPGGLALAATRIARAVEAHKGKVTVFVRHHAMSAWHADCANGRPDRDVRTFGAGLHRPANRSVSGRLGAAGGHRQTGDLGR